MAPTTVKKLCCVVCLMIVLISSSFQDSTTTYTTYYTEYPPYTVSRRSEYRSLDGSCNNKYDSNLGKAFTPFKRYLPCDYADRRGIPYENRPSPRELSYKIFEENTNDSLEAKVNGLFVFYGQFIVHDLALTEANDDSIQCCPINLNPCECMRIIPEKEDELVVKNITTCLNFVRSLGVKRKIGKTVKREQINAISHYMDGSFVYGSSRAELDKLLNYTTGKLKVLQVGNNPLLPTKKDIKAGHSCPLFIAGDNRLNENPVLAMFHTIWMREHNLIVDRLFEIHPNWTSDILFEEARKIVIAETQFITYDEFLPLLIGNNLMNSFNLFSNYSYHYNPKIDPTISNAFTTAAFRFGHVMIDDFIFLQQKNTDQQKRNTTNICKRKLNKHSCDTTLSIPLEGSLKNPDELYECENSIDAIVKGSIERRAQKFNDMRAAKTLTLKSPMIHDLISFNIQRGRDHGIPTYNEWRNWTGKEPLKFWSSSISHSQNVIEKLKSLYKNESQVDLFVGGVLETKTGDHVLGPTFAYIVAKQFHDLKFGDKFWYQRDLTKGQIPVIERQTMSHIILRNTNIDFLPSNSFVVPSTNNSVITTAESDFDFSPWI